MGFEFEEEEEVEEIPYSFPDYLKLSFSLSAKIFKAIAIKPKLSYWIALLTLSSIFVAIGGYSLLSKVNLEVTVTGIEQPEVEEMIRATIEFFTKNPVVLYVSSLFGLVISSIIGSIVLYLLVRIVGGAGLRFSSTLMIAGLSSVPGAVAGVLEAIYGTTLPEITWEINVSPMATQPSAPPFPPELIMTQSLITLFVGLWIIPIVYAACSYGFGVKGKKSVLIAVMTYVVVNLTTIWAVLTM